MHIPRVSRGRVATSLCTCAVLALCHASCLRAWDRHEAHHPFVGKTAPEIVAESVGGDGPKSVVEARGRVVILDFWATGCGPCKASFPIFQAIADRFLDQVTVIAVNIDGPEDKSRVDLLAFAKESRARFSIVWDKDGSVREKYRVGAIPSTFILDRNGTVRHSHQGYGDGYEDVVTREVEELVNAETAIRQAAPPVDEGRAPVQAFSCEVKPGGINDFLSEFERSNPADFGRCSKTPGCMDDRLKRFRCDQCMKASCCEETRACIPRAFASGSAARANAARCRCLFRCRHGSWPFSDCLGADRCGPAADTAVDPYPAVSNCVETHCSDVCPKEHGRQSAER